MTGQYFGILSRYRGILTSDFCSAYLLLLDKSITNIQ